MRLKIRRTDQPMGKRDIKFLSIVTDVNRFFKSLKPGEIFNFSDGYSFREIKSIGERRNVRITYCKPGTPEYEKYGCFTAKVAVPEPKKPEVFHFNTELLDV